MTQKVSGGEWANERLRRWFTMLPNIVDDSDLDPHEVRLLYHYYRVGDCWESVRTTAEKCKMGAATVSRKRRALAKKGWIRVEDLPGGGIQVVVIDKWEENAKNYTGDPQRNGRSTVDHGRSTVDHGRSTEDHGRSTVEPKNNNIRRTSKKMGRARGDFQKKIETEQEILRMGEFDRDAFAKWLRRNKITIPENETEWNMVTHPAVICWMDVTGRWPTYDAIPHIIDTLGDAPDRDAFKRVWDLWRASGYSETNISGVLDRYKRDAQAEIAGRIAAGSEAARAWDAVLEKIRHKRRGFTDREREAIQAAGGAYNIRTANDYELNKKFRPAFLDAWRQSAAAEKEN